MYSKYLLVYQRENGKWYIEKLFAAKASDKRDTQRQAENRAEELLENAGGGVVVSMGEYGDVSTWRWPVPS